MRAHWSVGTGYSLGPWRRDMMGRLQRAASKATDRASLEGRDKIRSAMRAQRLGNLANVIKQTSDQRKRRVHKKSENGFSVSGVIYIGAKNERTLGALKSYLDGPVSISPTAGRKWMAIATNQIPKRVGRHRMTPARYKAGGLEEKIGPLRFVPTSRANVAYLIADNVTTKAGRSGSARRLPKSGRPRAGRQHVGVVAFVLIRITHRAKRVDVQQIVEEYQRRIIPYMARELQGIGPRSRQSSGVGYGFSL